MPQNITLTLEIGISITCPDWAEGVPDAEEVCRRAVMAAVEGAGEEVPPNGEIGIALTDDDELHRLNLAYRGKDKPTNVLSFPGDGADEPTLPDMPVMIGDIAVAWQTAASEATTQNIPLVDHLAHLIVHGTLHLLGHDHIDTTGAETMERLETEILAGLGIDDPYAGSFAIDDDGPDG